jgi:hypothetical protein
VSSSIVRPLFFVVGLPSAAKVAPPPPIEPVESFLHKVGRWGVEKFKQYPANGLFIGHYLH